MPQTAIWALTSAWPRVRPAKSNPVPSTWNPSRPPVPAALASTIPLKVRYYTTDKYLELFKMVRLIAFCQLDISILSFSFTVTRRLFDFWLNSETQICRDTWRCRRAGRLVGPAGLRSHRSSQTGYHLDVQRRTGWSPKNRYYISNPVCSLL
jgi:hypothetical protein